MWISERGQRPDLDMRHPGGLYRADGTTTQWEQARDSDGIKILDRVDDMLIILGFEDLHL